MKIFNNEDGVKKVYIQLSDIAMLFHSDTRLPLMIMADLIRQGMIEPRDNKQEFREFTELDEIEILRGVDWIIDFKTYYDLSSEKLQNEMEIIALHIEALTKEIDRQDIDDKIRDGLIRRRDCLEYKLDSIRDVLRIKKGLCTMPFPVVKDDNGAYLVSDDVDAPFTARQGINPMQMIITCNKGTISDWANDNYNLFVQAAEALLVNRAYGEIEPVDNYEFNREFSDDGKTLVITLLGKVKENNMDNFDKGCLSKKLINGITDILKKK